MTILKPFKEDVSLYISFGSYFLQYVYILCANAINLMIDQHFEIWDVWEHVSNV